MSNSQYNLINSVLELELKQDTNIDLIFPESVRCDGISPKNCGLLENQGLAISYDLFHIPFFEDDLILIRVLENDLNNACLDVEIVDCEYSEFNGAIASIPKDSFKILKWIS